MKDRPLPKEFVEEGRVLYPKCGQTMMVADCMIIKDDFDQPILGCTNCQYPVIPVMH